MVQYKSTFLITEANNHDNESFNRLFYKLERSGDPSKNHYRWKEMPILGSGGRLLALAPCGESPD